MIGLIIRVMLAILANKACSMGQPVDYYAWVYGNENFRVVWSTEGHVWGDYWIMQAGGENVLFKFKQPISETIASGASHGECARLIK